MVKPRESLGMALLPLVCCGGPLLVILAVTAGPALLAWLGGNAVLLLVLALGGIGLLGIIVWRRHRHAGAASPVQTP